MKGKFQKEVRMYV